MLNVLLALRIPLAVSRMNPRWSEFILAAESETRLSGRGTAATVTAAAALPLPAPCAGPGSAGAAAALGGCRVGEDAGDAAQPCHE